MADTLYYGFYFAASELRESDEEFESVSQVTGPVSLL